MKDMTLPSLIAIVIGIVICLSVTNTRTLKVGQVWRYCNENPFIKNPCSDYTVLELRGDHIKYKDEDGAVKAAVSKRYFLSDSEKISD